MHRDRPPRTRSLIMLGGAGAVVLLGLGACTSSGSAAPSTSAGSDSPPATVAPASADSGTPGATPVTSTPVTSAPTSSSTRSVSSSPLPSSDPSPLTTVPTSPVRTLHPVPLRSTAEFGTGVSARVTAVTHGKDRDQGPGAATGRPTVLFHLRLTNGSSRKVSVANVQVLATYGSSGTPAIAATTSTREFSGTLRSGRNTDAVYAFAVPSSGQGAVSVTVTYTAGQPTVLLTGSAR